MSNFEYPRFRVREPEVWARWGSELGGGSVSRQWVACLSILCIPCLREHSAPPATSALRRAPRSRPSRGNAHTARQSSLPSDVGKAPASDPGISVSSTFSLTSGADVQAGRGRVLWGMRFGTWGWESAGWSRADPLLPCREVGRTLGRPVCADLTVAHSQVRCGQGFTHRGPFEVTETVYTGSLFNTWFLPSCRLEELLRGRT